jgi:hypothetical protein
MGWAFPTLKRGANERCAYGAGRGADLELAERMHGFRTLKDGAQRCADGEHRGQIENWQSACTALAR